MSNVSHFSYNTQITVYDLRNYFATRLGTTFSTTIDIVYCDWCMTKVISLVDPCGGGVTSITTHHLNNLWKKFVSLALLLFVDQVLCFWTTVMKQKLTASATESQWKEREKASSCEGRVSWFQYVRFWNFAFTSQQLEFFSSDISEAFLLTKLFFPMTKPAED